MVEGLHLAIEENMVFLIATGERYVEEISKLLKDIGVSQEKIISFF